MIFFLFELNKTKSMLKQESRSHFYFIMSICSSSSCEHLFAFSKNRRKDKASNVLKLARRSRTKKSRLTPTKKKVGKHPGKRFEGSF